MKFTWDSVQPAISTVPELWNSWSWQVAHGLKTPEQFERWVGPLTAEEKSCFDLGAALFRVQTTPYYASLIRQTGLEELRLASAEYRCGKENNNLSLQIRGQQRALNVRQILPWESARRFSEYQSLYFDELDLDDRRDRSFMNSFNGSIARLYSGPLEDLARLYDSAGGNTEQLFGLDWNTGRNDFSGDPANWSPYQWRTGTPSERFTHLSQFFPTIGAPRFTPSAPSYSSFTPSSGTTAPSDSRTSGRFRQ